MIKDPAITATIRAQWAAVEALGSDGNNVMMAWTMTVTLPPKDPRFYNLPLLLAYATLEQVLEELAYQGAIPPPTSKPTLQSRMSASVGHLSWQDYGAIDDGRKGRNKLAHDAALLSKQECREYIKAIGVELTAWGVL